MGEPKVFLTGQLGHKYFQPWESHKYLTSGQLWHNFFDHGRAISIFNLRATWGQGNLKHLSKYTLFYVLKCLTVESIQTYFSKHVKPIDSRDSSHNSRISRKM